MNPTLDAHDNNVISWTNEQRGCGRYGCVDGEEFLAGIIVSRLDRISSWGGRPLPRDQTGRYHDVFRGSVWSVTQKQLVAAANDELNFLLTNANYA